MEKVVLVDEQDRVLGLMEKMEAHKKGVLHRAFSVFVFNDQGEIMLQQRALSKYHSGGLWTNTVCSHPRDGETYEEAAHRRLKEEMGFDCEIEFALKFIYKAKLDGGLWEHELDHVFTGTYNEAPVLNPAEAESFKWATPDWIANDIKANPDHYTAWFKIIFDRFFKAMFIDKR